MNNKRNKIISFIIALCILLSSCNMIAFAGAKKTSTGFRYLQQYMNTVINYPSINRFNAKGTVAIPGLEYTNVNGSGCNTMVPQGLCTTDDYILISAYDGIELYKTNLKDGIKVGVNKKLYSNESKHYLHNSVIYVLSKSDKKYLTTLVLPDCNHVGGLAFDGEYVWVAKGSDCCLSAIKISAIKKAVESKKDSVSISYYQTVSCGIRASVVSYYDNRLWVGVFNQDYNGSLKGFDIYKNENDRLYLIPYRTVALPNKVNGVALATINGKTEMVVNTSYGRNSASKAYFYTLNIAKNSSLSDYKAHPVLKLPPMAEEICIDGSRVYTLFESGATTYSRVSGNRAQYVVDRVCVSSISKIFPWANSAKPDKIKSVPSPVTDLKLKSSTNNSITIEWSSVNGADGYYVYRYITSSDSYVRQATLDSNATSYTQTGLSSAIDYDYLVVPFNSSGAARTGNLLFAMTLPNKAKITTLTATKKKHSITTEWDAVTRAEGYEIQYCENKKFKTDVIKKTASSDTLIDKTKKFTKGKTYYVRVRAYSTYAGKTYYGAWSDTKSIIAK